MDTVSDYAAYESVQDPACACVLSAARHSLGIGIVTKHMRMDHLRELRGLPGMPADQIHGLGGHWARAGLAGKEPGLRLGLSPLLP